MTGTVLQFEGSHWSEPLRELTELPEAPAHSLFVGPDGFGLATRGGNTGQTYYRTPGRGWYEICSDCPNGGVLRLKARSANEYYGLALDGRLRSLNYYDLDGWPVSWNTVLPQPALPAWCAKSALVVNPNLAVAARGAECDYVSRKQVDNTWTLDSLPPQGCTEDCGVNSLWSDDESLFAGGTHGRIWSFDAESQQWIGRDTPFASGVQALWGISFDNLYAGTQAEGLWHYDGVEWTPTEATGRIDKIDGTGPEDIFAVGALFWHFDGKQWTTFTKMATTPVVSFSVTSSTVTTLQGYSDVHELVRPVAWDCATSETNCDNHVDDDCNGFIDALDAACSE
jgi:hypothetical protein